MSNNRTLIKLVVLFLMIAACWLLFNLLYPLLSVKKTVFGEVSEDVSCNNAHSDTVHYQSSDKSKDNDIITKFSGVSFDTIDVHKREIHIIASKILEETTKKIILENMKASFVNKNESLFIDARKAILKNVNKTIYDLYDDVSFYTDKENIIYSKNANVDLNKNSILGKEKVKILYKNKIEFFADEYCYDLSNNIFKIIGNVKGKCDKQYIEAERLDVSLNSITKRELSKLQIYGKVIRFKSDQYELKANNSLVYSNNNIDMLCGGGITYNNCCNDNYQLQSMKMQIKFNDSGNLQSINAKNNAKLIYTQMNNMKKYVILSDNISIFIKMSKIDKAELCDNIKIISDDLLIKADEGVFMNNKLFLKNNVILMKEEGNVFGSSASIDINTGEVNITNSSGILNHKNERNK